MYPLIHAYAKMGLATLRGRFLDHFTAVNKKKRVINGEKSEKMQKYDH
jgi:hypothetical protein